MKWERKAPFMNLTSAWEINVEWAKILQRHIRKDKTSNRIRFFRFLWTIEPNPIDFPLICYWKSISQWRDTYTYWHLIHFVMCANLLMKCQLSSVQYRGQACHRSKFLHTQSGSFESAYLLFYYLQHCATSIYILPPPNQPRYIFFTIQNVNQLKYEKAEISLSSLARNNLFVSKFSVK